MNGSVIDQLNQSACLRGPRAPPTPPFGRASAACLGRRTAALCRFVLVSSLSLFSAAAASPSPSGREGRPRTRSLRPAAGGRAGAAAACSPNDHIRFKFLFLLFSRGAFQRAGRGQSHAEGLPRTRVFQKWPVQTPLLQRAQEGQQRPTATSAVQLQINLRHREELFI